MNLHTLLFLELDRGEGSTSMVQNLQFLPVSDFNIKSLRKSFFIAEHIMGILITY